MNEPKEPPTYLIRLWRWFNYQKPLDGTWRDFFPDWKMVYTHLAAGALLGAILGLLAWVTGWWPL